jgi:MFS family permease
MAHSVLRLARSVGWWDALATPGPPRLLSVNALTDAAGTGLAAVCLPFFAVRVAGISAVGVALCLSAAGLCEVAAAVPNGAIAARIGIVRFVIATKLAQAAAFTALAFAHGLGQVVVLAAITGAARAGQNGLNQALTVSVLGEEQRAGALGSIRALRNIGYLGAGAAASYVLASGSHVALRIALVVNGASFLVGAACVLRLRLGEPAAAAAADKTNWSVLTDFTYLGLILAAAVFGSSLVVIDVGLPLWVLRYPVIPAWTVAMVVTLNTLIVVLFQYRFSTRISRVDQAVRAIGLSAVAFCVMSAALVLTPHAGVVIGVVLFLVVAAALTVGELCESPAWWTVSFKLAPKAQVTEYLSAFDLCWAVVGVAGPAAMAGVVALGPSGWVWYGVLVVLAGAAAVILIRRRAPLFDVASRAEDAGSPETSAPVTP